MPPQPVIETARLRLRPFVPDDAPALRELAGARAIADTTISVPHPFDDAAAREWITTHTALWPRDAGAGYAITTRADGALVGSIELRDADPEHRQAEVSFWVGMPFWGRGYAHEAVTALVRLAFDTLDLNRLYAHHMVRNPASGRVLEKAGFRREGLLRQRVRKWGVYEDVVLLARLRTDDV